MKSQDDFFRATLSGDWTICGISRQVELLMNYPFMHAVGKGEVITIDCSQIEGIDINGLQLLFVWLQCIRLHGMVPSLVNLTEEMVLKMTALGLIQNFADDYREKPAKSQSSALTQTLAAFA